MKNSTIVSTVPMLLLLAACQQPAPVQDCPPQPLTELFMGQIQYQSEDVTYLEGASADIIGQIVAPVFKKAFQKELKAIDPLWEVDANVEKVNLTPEEILRHIIDTDGDTLKPDEVLYLRPYEKWYLQENHVINREILGLTFVMHNIDKTTGQVRGTEPMFHLENNPKGEAKKVATISYRQPINKARDGWSWFHENLEGSVKSKFLGSLLDQVSEGQMTVFKTSDLKEALDQSDIGRLKSSVDTVYIEAAEPPFDLSMHVLKRRTGWSDIVAIDLVQDIFVYPNGAISIDTKAYAPVVSSKEIKTGEEFFQSALFWVKNE